MFETAKSEDTLIALSLLLRSCFNPNLLHLSTASSTSRSSLLQSDKVPLFWRYCTRINQRTFMQRNCRVGWADFKKIKEIKLQYFLQHIHESNKLYEASFSYCIKLPGPANIVEEGAMVKSVVIRRINLSMVAGGQRGHLVPMSCNKIRMNVEGTTGE
jgi:hypothetical protein